MPTHFDLIITADHPNYAAEFRLLDAHGSQIAYRRTNFTTITASHVQGLFDLRNYLRLFVEDGRETAAVAEIGVCIAEDVLGEGIFEHLWRSESQRTLRIQLPGAGERENYLAAAMARVPWEIARPADDKPTLAERNLLVRIVHDMEAPASEPMELALDEPLRVLFVFAEARGSRPLGARQERRELLRLFEREIYPHRRVVGHFITHGVTRERLEAQIRENNGYHVVHWSGHGHLNLLELAKPGGKADHISGGELLDLFTKPDVGGFIPRLVFLSACHSGDILRVKDWNDFFAVAQGKEPGAKDAGTKQLDFKEQPGFTGTAHALLQGGVPSVVAMRYAVGDDYARELAVEFYRALLAHAQPKTAAAALTQARQALLDAKKHDPTRFAVCDHATPVLYGAEEPGLTLAKGRSPDLNPRNPCLHQIVELTSAAHEHFVGRTWELTGLGADFIGSARGAEVKPVAIITGLGGMGKTALAAEALALWEKRFEWVLLYQAKPNALGFEATLRDVHLKLMGELKLYHNHVRTNPADAVYRDATAEFTGPERLERLTRNLVRVLKDEAILLVLDNLETNLKEYPEPESATGQPFWACKDPAWDRCLATLTTELVGSPSRVIITSRRPPAALADGVGYAVLLGPLRATEAALYLNAHPVLSRMVFGGDREERKLAERLLNASRFHPLLMDRLARLAGDENLRSQLMQALDTLEKTKDFAQLPALFATRPGDAKELAYLNDALAASLDQLIRNAGPDARRVLWLIAVANDPVSFGLLQGVWSGESHENQQLRQMKQMLDRLPLLPPELQEKLKATPPELRAAIDALPPEPPARPEIEPLLRHLVSMGMAMEERSGPEDDNPDYTCHELVRERICDWMDQEQDDRGGLTENTIRLAYAQMLEEAFEELQHINMATALRAGSQALIYCVQAEDWDRMCGFASAVVTSTSDSRFLKALVPHLRTAAESSPEGKARWNCLCTLADALRNGGWPDMSLPFYEQAATLAHTVAEAGYDGSRLAWADVAWITGNWAGALYLTGNFDAARQCHIESAKAEMKAGNPAINIIGNELEALRIDIVQGKADAALPEIEARLVKVKEWWKQHCSGRPVPEAPDAELLVRALIAALDIARKADCAKNDFDSALRRQDAILRIEHMIKRPAGDIAATRFNRATVLSYLGRFVEARAELEDCLQLFQNNPEMHAKVLGSFADLFDNQGDTAQAITQGRRALSLFEQLPNPEDRAISHSNLSKYLNRSSVPSFLAEAPFHQLADLVYCLAARLGESLQASLFNYAIEFRRAHAAGTDLAVPRVAQLLADPAFHPLEQWLRQRQVNLDELQAAADQFLEQARQTALSQK